MQTDGHTEWQTNGWTDTQTDKFHDNLADRQVGRLTSKTEEMMEGFRHRQTTNALTDAHTNNKQIIEWTDGWTEGKINERTDGQTDKPRNIQTDTRIESHCYSPLNRQ